MVKCTLNLFAFIIIRILSVGAFIQGMKLGANYVESEFAILTPFPHHPPFWNSSAPPTIP